MDSDYVQHVRYKLQKRLKRLSTADDPRGLHWALVQTWAFLQENEITRGILDDLVRRVPHAEQTAEQVVEKPVAGFGEREIAQAAVSYWVLKKCLASGKENYALDIGQRFGLRLSDYLHRGGQRPGGGRGLSDDIDAFSENFIEPLFDYLDEQIDDKRMTLTLLKKYKHRCEWFRRDELRQACEADTRRGEKTLAYNLYEYLHDQGIQFHIEPQSDSGRVDLVSAQSGPDRLVADTKVFDPARSLDRGYIVKGFRQIYDYTKDYNEPFGYLEIFKTCEADLSISTPKQESGTPFIIHNNKTIFILVIDICDYEASASKRGKLRAHEITTDQFIEAIPTLAGGGVATEAPRTEGSSLSQTKTPNEPQ
jgi:hypothetical protein